MYDLIALAFQTDSTRVVTYVVRTELRGGSYPEWGLSKDYHSLTHHGNDPQNLEELAKADTIYMRHWARFLRRLRAIKEGDDTLLDAILQCMEQAGRIHMSERSVGLVGRGPKLSQNERKLMAQLIERYRDAGVQPPSVKQCQKEAASNQVSRS